MPHATEGDLHAYVDGALSTIDPGGAERLVAHVNDCSDCRNRLEEARALRDESARLLDVALGGAVEPPAFEEVLARAARESGPGRGGVSPGPTRSGERGRPSQRLAWAASVAIALGAGWMGHAVLGGGELRFTSETRLPRELDAVAEATPARQPGLDPSIEESVLEAPPPQIGDERRNEQAVAPREDVVGLRDAAGSASSSEANVPSSVVEAPDPDRADLAQGRVAAVEAQVDAKAADDAPAPSAERLQASASDVDAPASASPLMILGEATELESSAFAAPTLEGLSWNTVDRQAAELANGGTIATIPSFEIIDFAVSDGSPVRTRVRQRMPGGETVELISADAGSADALEPSRRARQVEQEAREAARPETVAGPDGLTEVWIELRGMRIRVRAPVAPDSLRGLISRIR